MRTYFSDGSYRYYPYGESSIFDYWADYHPEIDHAMPEHRLIIQVEPVSVERMDEDSISFNPLLWARPKLWTVPNAKGHRALPFYARGYDNLAIEVQS